MQTTVHKAFEKDADGSDADGKEGKRVAVKDWLIHDDARDNVLTAKSRHTHTLSAS